MWLTCFVLHNERGLHMSQELSVLVFVTISVLLISYLAQRTARALAATETFDLKGAIQCSLYTKARRCAEIAYRNTPPPKTIGEIRQWDAPLRLAENEFIEAAKVARTIGYPVSLEWTDTYEEIRHIPREPGECSNPTHQQPS